MGEKKVRNVLIGGAWPYANNPLHLGHLSALISGDLLKRYHKLLGDNVIYVSGSDCHGTPITERAKDEGVEPKDIAQRYDKEFNEVFNKMNFSYDLYTRTFDEYHKKRVEDMFLQIYKNGYIYSQKTEQPYCEECKRFESDRDLELVCPRCGEITKGDQCDCGYIPTEEDLVGATCRECGNKTVQKENTHLYLALSKLQKQIEEYVEREKINWRIASINETQKYLKEGLKDRAVTRDLTWGINIPVEGFNDKKMYVWIDAVLGYLTATQKYCEENGLNWEKYWKKGNNVKMYMCHGKDNITFHTIILPGLLIALDEEYHLPDVMVASQYLNINSEKISKSKGNGITVLQMIENYNVDSLRYYMISHGPENRDVDFTIEHYVSTHNSDIVNKFGNFVNRTLKFKELESIPLGVLDSEMDSKIDEAYEKVSGYIEKLEFKKACGVIIDLIEIGNKYYDDQKPWVQRNENIEKFNNCIYTCANVIANLSNLLEPIMPAACSKLRKYLRLETPSWEKIQLKEEIPLEDIETLFERIK